jgi:hypothetical protein
MHPARLTAMLLLLAWVGPVTFAQTDSWRLLKIVGAPESASAGSHVIPAGEAIVLEPGTPLKLRLRDGSVLKGRFLARTLMDSAFYAPRFAAHIPSHAVLALGETLSVSLRDGRQWIAPFAGYAELTLLLRNPDGQLLRVPFESAKAIRRANGGRVKPNALARAFQAGSLPSAEVLVLEEFFPVANESNRWSAERRVAVEDIDSASVESPSGTNVALTIVLTVVATVVLIILVIKSGTKSAEPSCGSAVPPSLLFAGAHFTTRPFDRDRGCYVGDTLAVADAWPGSSEIGPATALANPATSPILAR